MSGHAEYNYSPSNIPKDIKIINVPVITANKETLEGYCDIVNDFNNTKVINVPWIKLSGRPIDDNTGDQALPTEGIFEFSYDKHYCLANNHSVPNGDYITGIINENRDIYTREANYHPCGGQIVYPCNNNSPFIILLSKAGDNIQPTDFVAFYCDGTFGVQILPNVWHQPIFPINNNVKYFNKQCSVHACVTVDTIKEFNTLLKFNLPNES